MGDLAMNEN